MGDRGGKLVKIIKINSIHLSILKSLTLTFKSLQCEFVEIGSPRRSPVCNNIVKFWFKIVRY